MTIENMNLKSQKKRKCLVFSLWRMAGQYFVSMAQSGLVSASDASAEKIARRPKLMPSFIKNIAKILKDQHIECFRGGKTYNQMMVAFECHQGEKVNVVKLCFKK